MTVGGRPGVTEAGVAKFFVKLGTPKGRTRGGETWVKEKKKTGEGRTGEKAGPRKNWSPFIPPR